MWASAGNWGLCIGLLAIGSACASPPVPPQSRSQPASPTHWGRLDPWEEPREFGAPPVGSHALVIASPSTDYDNTIAGVFAVGTRLVIRTMPIEGHVDASATDGRGNVLALVRPTIQTAVGPRFALETQLRGYRLALDAEPFEPDFDPGKTTVDPLCGADGAVGGWLDPFGEPERFVWLHGVGSAPFPASSLSDVSRSLRCSFGAARTCSSILSMPTAETYVLTRICNGAREDETLHRDEHVWSSSTQLHPSGTLADYDADRSFGGHSRVVLRAPGGSVRRWEVEGRVYAATFKDPHRVFVHTAHDDPDRHGQRVFVTEFEVDAGPGPRRSLDAMRGHFDQGAWPPRASVLTPQEAFRTPMLLPRHGNGRPLLFRIDGHIVLVSGRGAVWSWPAVDRPAHLGAAP